MTASQRRCCSDFAEDRTSRFTGPKRHRLHRQLICVNLRPITIGLQIATDESMSQSLICDSNPAKKKTHTHTQVISLFFYFLFRLFQNLKIKTKS